MAVPLTPFSKLKALSPPRREPDNQTGGLGQMTAPKLVTIGLPIWKRLENLPHVLKIVEAQDYPSIELLVSDNGMNGTKVRDTVQANYSRPFTFRQNSSIAEISEHFNQIVHQAAGEYFVLLCDDDEISSNFVSELVRSLERFPEASLALARQEIIDENDVVVRKSNDIPRPLLSGAEFIRGTWQKYEFGFEGLVTNLARTSHILACGGYPNFTRGTGIDNALIIKLCLNSNVAFSREGVFRWRVYESSHGWSVSIKDLAASAKEFMGYLESDPGIRELAKRNPEQWKELKASLLRNEWQTYFWRWRDVYKPRLSYLEWIKAAFAMPLYLNYYRKVASVFRKEAKVQTMRLLGIAQPGTKELGSFGRDT